MYLVSETLYTLQNYSLNIEYAFSDSILFSILLCIAHTLYLCEHKEE